MVSGKSARPAVPALAALAGCALVAPSFADAHAVLERTDPQRGAALARPPERVTLEFNEPVEASFGAVRVYDSDAQRVDTGALERPDGSAEAVTAELERDLPEGTYTATYRVVSADSHPVSGGFVFTVGEPSAGGGPGVDELVDAAGAGPVTDTAFGVSRAASYAATALVVGVVMFAVWCWGPAVAATAPGDGRWHAAAAAFVRRARGLLALGLGLGALATATGIVLQGALALGESFWAALDPDIVGEVLSTRFGTAWGLRLVDFLLLAVPCLVPRWGLRLAVLAPVRLGADGAVPVDPLPAGRLATAGMGLGLGYLVLVPGFAGHPGATDPRWLTLAISFVHVLAFAVWAGGLATAAAAMPAATKRLAGPDRTVLLAAALERFSTIAVVSVAAIAVTGLLQAFTQLDAWSDLVETGYGRAVCAKVALLVCLVGLGARSRRALAAIRDGAGARATPGAAGAALRRTLRAELGLIAAVLAATAVLAASSPSAVGNSGPFTTAVGLGPARAEVTVDPAAVGANEIHLYLFDGRTGAQYDAAKELTVDASLPAEDLGPLELEVRKAGPGHYVARAAPLGVPGDWTLEIAARVSAFDQHRAATEVPIR